MHLGTILVAIFKVSGVNMVMENAVTPDFKIICGSFKLKKMKLKCCSIYFNVPKISFCKKTI